MPNAAWRNEDWTRCVAFHGHECPGLAIGFMAAKAGLAWIESTRAEDEEVVTIVENDACGVDAVQVLTGCTFGKGNLIHKDYGKQVFTFFNRDTGRAGALFAEIRRDAFGSPLPGTDDEKPRRRGLCGGTGRIGPAP